MDQRDREPRVRIPGGQRWRRVHLVAQQPRESRSRPGRNDPVADRPGEAIYLRDEETGELWTATPAPIRHEQAHVLRVRTAWATAVSSSVSHGFSLELTLLVPPDDPDQDLPAARAQRFAAPRSISVTAYVEWVLGAVTRAAARRTSSPSSMPQRRAVRAQPLERAFPGVAFADLAGARRVHLRPRASSWVAMARSTRPAALVSGGHSRDARARHSIRAPRCAAHDRARTLVEHRIRVPARRGGEDGEARALVDALSRAPTSTRCSTTVRAHWEELTGHVQVKTPDRAFDIMMNGWLLYQTLACRTWARAGFYQASGAYGFRDQLQDAMALALAQPQLLREQILRAAARQFPEGDVQHWWLPHNGQGVRTHISDDRVWLSFVTAHYVDAHRRSRHPRRARFPSSRARRCRANGTMRSSSPASASRQRRLFEHCQRGLEGARHGRARPAADRHRRLERRHEPRRRTRPRRERLARLVPARDAQRVRADRRRRAANSRCATAWLGTRPRALRAALEQHAWDGDWYRRGFFDDGTPLGSASNDECQIDAIAQSWSVISGAANPARAKRAMEALDAHLLQRDPPLALLFTPPFDEIAAGTGLREGLSAAASARTAASTPTPRSGP